MWSIKDNYFSIHNNTISLIFDITESGIKAGKRLKAVIQALCFTDKKAEAGESIHLPKVTWREPGRAAALTPGKEVPWLCPLSFPSL